MTSISLDDRTKGRGSDEQIDAKLELQNLIARYGEASNPSLEESSNERSQVRESDAQIDAKLKFQNLIARYGEASDSSMEENSNEKYTNENSNNIEELIGEEEEVCKSSEPKENGPTITCPECRRNFRSLKSLYGHLRSHPNRDYRGASKPPAPLSKRPADKRLIISHWQTKRARTRFDAEEDSEEFDAIEIQVGKALLMLKRGIEPMKKVVKTNSPLTKTNSPLLTKTRYNCNLCEKSFSTHQALGGHVASHNKHKNSEASDRNEADSSTRVAAAAAAEHKCTNCGELFETGQALGGHKRRYYNQPRRGVESYVEPSTSVVPAVVDARSKGLDFDLNEPWKPEDGSEM